MNLPANDNARDQRTPVLWTIALSVPFWWLAWLVVAR